MYEVEATLIRLFGDTNELNIVIEDENLQCTITGPDEGYVELEYQDGFLMIMDDQGISKENLIKLDKIQDQDIKKTRRIFVLNLKT